MGSARDKLESGSEDGGTTIIKKSNLNKFEMIQKLKDAKAIEKSILEDERKRALEEMNRAGD